MTWQAIAGVLRVVVSACAATVATALLAAAWVGDPTARLIVAVAAGCVALSLAARIGYGHRAVRAARPNRS